MNERIDVRCYNYSLSPRGTSGERAGERGNSKKEPSSPPSEGRENRPGLRQRLRRGESGFGRAAGGKRAIIDRIPLSPALSPLVPRGERENDFHAVEHSLNTEPFPRVARASLSRGRGPG